MADEGDITGQVSSGGPGMIGNIQDASPGQIPADLEHPLIWLFDAAMLQSKELCRAQGLPGPASFLWDNFSKPLMNKALWHYVPENMSPESPALCLGLGMAGLIGAHIPVYIAYSQQQKKKSIAENPKNKESVKQTLNPEKTEKSQEAGKPEKKPEPIKQAAKVEIKDKIPEEIIQKFGMNPVSIY